MTIDRSLRTRRCRFDRWTCACHEVYSTVYEGGTYHQKLSHQPKMGGPGLASLLSFRCDVECRYVVTPRPDRRLSPSPSMGSSRSVGSGSDRAEGPQMRCLVSEVFVLKSRRRGHADGTHKPPALCTWY